MKQSIPENFISRWSRNKLKRPANDGQNLIDKAAPAPYEEISADTLKRLIKQPEFHALDRLNEYHEDYTFFESRGELLTREMERALLRQDEVKTTEPSANAPANADQTILAATRSHKEKDGDSVVGPDDGLT